MSKQAAWSFSVLSSYETCPHRHYRLKVVKDITEPQSDEMKWGNRVHKAFEHRIKGSDVALLGMPVEWEAMAVKLLAKKGEKLAEQKMTLTKQMTATSWFGKDAWLRGIIDFLAIAPTGKVALALDWKTGKIKEDHDQLMLFAALVFHYYPAVETVRTGYVWLKHKCQITSRTFYRAELPEIWQEFLPRVRRLQSAHDNNKWEKKPSGLCRKWCPVLDCDFNGQS